MFRIEIVTGFKVNSFSNRESGGMKGSLPSKLSKFQLHRQVHYNECFRLGME